MKNGLKHGTGTYTRYDGVIYEGTWAFDKQVNHGMETWPDGT